MRKIKDIFEPLLFPDEYIFMEIYEFKTSNGTGVWVKVAETEIGEWTLPELRAVQQAQDLLKRHYEYTVKRRV